MKILSISLLLTVALNNLPTDYVPATVSNSRPAKERIKVYPTPDNRGSITVLSSNQASLSFYLFDLEGKLVYQTIIDKNEKQTVEGLTKGTYLYNAFEADKNLEKGKVVLK